VTRRRVLIALISLLSLAALETIYVALIAPRRTLSRLMAELTTVELDKTKLDDLRRLLQRTSHSHARVTCLQDSCGFMMLNDSLHKLRLEPLTAISGEVLFKDGIASEIYVRVEIDDAPDARGVMYPGTGATVHQSDTTKSCNQHYSSWVKQKGRYSWGIVTMDACVLPEDRKKALAINTACLTKIGGCRSVESILPAVFGNSENLPRLTD
jgi:hypothetical protein